MSINLILFVIILFINMLSAFKFRSLSRFCKNTAISSQIRSGSYTRPNKRQVDVEKAVTSLIKTSFRNDFREHGVPTKKNFLLCVSGGSDSIAMMHIMQKICKHTQPSMPVAVIFFNHKKRIESDEEETFVRDLAKSYDLPFFSETLPENMRHDISFQERARDWRRNISIKIIKELEESTANENKEHIGEFLICTAHTKDDHIETMLMKFLRGVHITNFQGMKILEGNFFKPLLNISKIDLIKYLNTNNYKWYEDASNQTKEYTRNKIRLDLIPLMEELCGGKRSLYDKLLKLSIQSNEIKDWIDDEVIKAYKTVKCRVNADPTCPIPYTMEIDHIVASAMPKLVLGKLIRNWLSNTIQKEINSSQIDEIVSHLYKPLGCGVPSQSICINKMYSVRHVRLGLQVIYHDITTNCSTTGSHDTSTAIGTMNSSSSTSSTDKAATSANIESNTQSSSNSSFASNTQLRTGFDQKPPKVSSKGPYWKRKLKTTAAGYEGNYTVIQYYPKIPTIQQQQQLQLEPQRLSLHKDDSSSNSSCYSNDTTATTTIVAADDHINIVDKTI